MGGQGPGESTEGPASPCGTGDLLEAGQYVQLAEILHQARLASEQRGDQISAHVLAMACRLCQACIQCRFEAEWYRQAHDQAGRQEQDLRHRLRAVIDLVGRAEEPGTLELLTADVAADSERPWFKAAAPPVHPGLWEHIRGFLRRVVAPQMPRTEGSALSAQEGEQTHAGKDKDSAVSSAASEVKAPVEAITGTEFPPPRQVGEPVLAPVQTGYAASTAATEQSEGSPADEADLQVVQPLVRGAQTVVASAQRSVPRPTEYMASLAVSPSTPEHVETEPIVTSIEGEREAEPGAPSLVVYCLGPFRVFQDDQPVREWPSSKGKSVFKYLITHREYSVPKEVLMELFWPGTHPDAARNNLNVAIYSLRQALRVARPSFSHLLFRQDCYLFNPDIQVWVDCEAFSRYLADAQALDRCGELAHAIREYRAAEALYQGEFLEEDRYEDWLVAQRQSLQEDYLALLDRLSGYYFEQEDYTSCTTLCRQMLAVDVCREEAHRRLMRCYVRQGQPYLALRQYHLCAERLKEELDVPPAQETTALCERIRRGKQI